MISPQQPEDLQSVLQSVQHPVAQMHWSHMPIISHNLRVWHKKNIYPYNFCSSCQMICDILKLPL